MSTLNFNANEVEPSIRFEPLPAGKYQAIITDSKIKSTKDHNGQYLQLEFEIIGDKYQGRRVWSLLNLENPNPTTVRIARANLSAICRAVNVLQPKDSTDLHNIPLTITICCKKNDYAGMVNEIKGYGPRVLPCDTPAPAQDNSTPPWARN